MANVRISEGAEEDYVDSLSWYAERSKSAAEGLETEFARALEEIAASPNRFPSCDDRHRCYLLKRYPFQIIYRMASEDCLLVVALAHTSRSPRYWSGR